ncbi:MAG: 50S ribosomal protein L20 [Candidatus Gottesmanbacteria bacterium]
MRVKRGIATHAKHKKLLAGNKGYRMTKRRLIRVAKEASLHAGQYAYVGRKNKKRDFRRLWIIRINGFLNGLDVSYSQFIAGLKKANIILDRKILAELIIDDPETFKKVVEKSRT